MDPPLPGRDEAEAGIIPRVADHDHDAVAAASAFPQPLVDECCADSPALEILVDCQGGEGERSGLVGIGNDSDRREQDMTDNPVATYRDEREFTEIVPVIPEGIHKPCLAILPERLEIDLEDRGDIFRKFRPDNKRIHPVLLDV
jgi:hypothetical protein